MKNIKDEIVDINDKLLKWAEVYYVKNRHAVSDSEYDGLYEKYSDLINNNKDLEPEDSILKKVGASLDNRFKKVEHSYKMLSLSNAFNGGDLLKFDKQIKDLLHDNSDIEYVIEYKIDGLSISIQYENGKLIRAITRGDGVIGEDVTHNVLVIETIPKTIDFKGKLEVRGEIFMSDRVFESLNSNGAEFANPRNAASGSIRQLDSKVTRKRKLSAFIYEMPDKSIGEFGTHYDILDFMNKQGFKTNDETVLSRDIHEVISNINILEKKRKELGYAVDGIVVKVNAISLYEDIGYTVKFPKFMIAYKFPAEIATTVLEDIFVTIGRTGRVTYNAKLSPVRLAGSIVSAATLHNADYVRELGINIGDSIKVKKAGDIIPKVIGISSKNNNERWVESMKCPGCNSELIRVGNEIDQYCTNTNCGLIKISQLEHFVSKNAMNIEGVSTQIIKTLLEHKLINGIASLYILKMKRDELIDLPGFKQKSVDSILKAIETSKSQELGKFLFGLGIRHLGAKGSNVLARRFGTLELIDAAKYEDILAIRDFGAKAARSVVDFFNNEKTIVMIETLKEYKINLKEAAIASSDKFKGMTFVVTGTLSKKRKVYSDLIENNSGNVSSAVSKNTTYLLVGKNPGSKATKAKGLDVKIITEKQFDEMIGD